MKNYQTITTYSIIISRVTCTVDCKTEENVGVEIHTADMEMHLRRIVTALVREIPPRSVERDIETVCMHQVG